MKKSVESSEVIWTEEKLRNLSKKIIDVLIDMI